MALTKLVIDVAAGTEEIIELIQDEIVQHNKLQADAEKEAAVAAKAETDKTAAKAAIASRLGLSADELATLLS